jgi:hypothetical protein
MVMEGMWHHAAPHGIAQHVLLHGTAQHGSYMGVVCNFAVPASSKFTAALEQLQAPEQLAARSAHMYEHAGCQLTAALCVCLYAVQVCTSRSRPGARLLAVLMAGLGSIGPQRPSGLVWIGLGFAAVCKGALPSWQQLQALGHIHCCRPDTWKRTDVLVLKAAGVGPVLLLPGQGHAVICSCLHSMCAGCMHACILAVGVGLQSPRFRVFNS